MEEESVEIKIPEYLLDKECTEIEHKLAHLLIDGTIFCNNGWWHKKDGTPWQEDCVTLHVNCNDIFYWACADAESITYSQVSELYEMWKQNKGWGAAAWCIKKRKQMPQPPVEKAMKDAGYNLEELVNGYMEG